MYNAEQINRAVDKIAHMYKTYKLKSKIYNVFQKLPRDLQHKIIYHALESYRIKEENHRIKKLICKKINNFVDHIVNPLSFTYNSSPNIADFLTKDEQFTFVYISHLVSKYYHILDYKELRIFFYINLCLHNNYCIHKLDKVENSGWENIADSFIKTKTVYKKIVPMPFFKSVQKV